jgi:nucleotide-binding universal stress UspA family protein
MAGWRSICCAIDFSEGSRTALHSAADLARRLGAELTLVHIHAPPAIAPGDVVFTAKLLEPAAGQLRRQLDDWRSEAERIVRRPVRVALFSGNPSVELARFVRANAFDAVVIGMHGQTAPSRFASGSVVDRVVRGARCPVLVVRGEAEQPAAVATTAAG